MVKINFENHNQPSISKLPYPLEYNPGVLLIFWVFRPRTVVYFGEKSAKITVFLADFFTENDQSAPKICRLGFYSRWGCIHADTVNTYLHYYMTYFTKSLLPSAFLDNKYYLYEIMFAIKVHTFLIKSIQFS